MELTEFIEDLEREWELNRDSSVVIEDEQEGLYRSVRRVRTETLHNGKTRVVVEIW